MGWPVKTYVALHNGESKISIPVFEGEGRYFSAVMIPTARDDNTLMRQFQEYKIRHELGVTIEEAVANCKSWIKENVWDNGVELIAECRPE